MKPLKGVMALTYTPLKKDFSLNEDAVRREIDWVIENGATGIWPGSYSGEWPQLDEETRKRHLKVVISHAGDRVFCAAGCHSTNTLQAIRLANYAEEVGYDCAWICPPTPRKATEDEIYDHYKMILDKTRLPIGLYNSYPAGTYMSPKWVAKLARMSERFVTMKEPVSDFCHIAGLYHEGVHKTIAIFGVEWNMLPHLILGSRGTAAGSDWIPVVFAVHDAFQNGDTQRAWQLQKTIIDQSPLLIPYTAGRALGGRVEHSNIGYMKARFSIMSGIDMGPPMPPYREASEAELARAREGIEKIGSLLSK